MSVPEPELQEKDFINESYKKNPVPFWIWLFLIFLAFAVLWGGNSWYFNTVDRALAKSPFLRVTNREMSLFLWQNPQYMRINSKTKANYLTGFQYVDNVAPFAELADEYVTAPPQVLFLYHTWKRLVSKEFTDRPITTGEFQKFLSHSREWLPDYWENAPAEYKTLISKLGSMESSAILPKEDIPLDVRMAFQGWKNYFIEGEEINKIQPTYTEMAQFIQSHPHFARNYWRNIFLSVAPTYLRNLSQKDYDPSETVSKDDMVPMLKVAFFNWKQANINP